MLAPAQVIFSAATADTDYEYLTSYGVAANDISKYRKYRLHFDKPAKKIYRQRYASNTSSWLNDSPDPLCSDVNRLIITNYNQESFIVELVVEKKEGATMKQHRVVSEFAPRMP